MRYTINKSVTTLFVITLLQIFKSETDRKPYNLPNEFPARGHRWRTRRIHIAGSAAKIQTRLIGKRKHREKGISKKGTYRN